MTRPDQGRQARQAQQAQQAQVSAAMSGAVDLSAVKARAEAQQRAKERGPATGPTSEFILDVDEAGFQDVVERSTQVPVIVDLWAEWCQPCKQLSPVLERLATEANGAWILARIDVDANPRIAQLFGAQSIPMVIAVVAGQPVDGFSGALPEPEVRQWITRLLDALRDRMPGIGAAEASGGAATDVVEEEPAEPEDPRFTAAEDAFERGDFDAAEQAYQAILDAEPANVDAKAALAQVRFSRRTEGAGEDALQRADAAPDDLDAQLAAADVQVAGQQVDEGFDRLIAAVGRTAGEDRDKVREHLVGLFELFPADDPRVAAARRKLASVLF